MKKIAVISAIIASAGACLFAGIRLAGAYVPPVNGVCVEAPGYPCSSQSNGGSSQQTHKGTTQKKKTPTVDKTDRIMVYLERTVEPETKVIKKPTKDCSDYDFCLTANDLFYLAINCTAIIERCQPAAPKWDDKTFDCKKKYAPAGVLPKEAMMTYTCKGLSNKVTTLPDLKEPLCKVAALVAADGYSLRVNSSYRSFDEQVYGWCVISAHYTSTAERKKYRAVPGTSNHGKGRAVDVTLLDENGNDFFTTDYEKHRHVRASYAKKLADYFYAADPNFNRLKTEVWHFEYGTGGNASVGKFTGLPK